MTLFLVPGLWREALYFPDGWIADYLRVGLLRTCPLSESSQNCIKNAMTHWNSNGYNGRRHNGTVQTSGFWKRNSKTKASNTSVRSDCCGYSSDTWWSSFGYIQTELSHEIKSSSQPEIRLWSFGLSWLCTVLDGMKSFDLVHYSLITAQSAGT